MVKQEEIPKGPRVSARSRFAVLMISTVIVWCAIFLIGDEEGRCQDNLAALGRKLQAYAQEHSGKVPGFSKRASRKFLGQETSVPSIAQRNSGTELRL